MLQDEVAVEQDFLDFSEDVEIGVEVSPAGLHHADAGVGEVVDGAHQEVGGGQEIGIEDGDKLAGREFETCLESARLVAFAVNAVEVLDVVANVAVTLAEGFGKLGGVVGGIVKNLNLEEFPGV